MDGTDNGDRPTIELFVKVWFAFDSHDNPRRATGWYKIQGRWAWLFPVHMTTEEEEEEFYLTQINNNQGNSTHQQ